MPKLKTNKSAAKRFTTTGTGKVKRNRSNSQHILTKKNAKRKRRLRQSTTMDKSTLKSVKRLVPTIF
ncbi:50S ribosomal protein L35 [Desulfoplanes formicivorans]|uniref:Large ribosomal subunit protein bL35 n=1 Tax=Desulfoplanes formicivorans TaxID=1592317 RepID=A0A194AHN5_9BACT|nr:50S ribosomal protein L35 [Desulfoplanes formicivorans]GAU08591.1 50S ribosomal protein L35 [Desulfoplanes formicivorans]